MVCSLQMGEEGHGGGSTLSDDSYSESEVKILRGRWELASVLNFLNVFKPLIHDKLKLTAEEIEMGLIESNSTNARLHIALLKGILPDGNSLEDSDAWITVMCKKLNPRWPWIAEGEMPITENQGEEISEYRGLDPTNRLQILKALCDLRAEQEDAILYVRENMKQGTDVSYFRKEKLGRDGTKTFYWFDGNDIQGYRLYREVHNTTKNTKSRKTTCLDLSLASFHWETLATNLEEFYKVSKELSSSKSASLAAIGQIIEKDAVPIVEKYLKKKENAMKKKMRQAKLVNMCYPMRITRSCSNRMPVVCTFDEPDQMVSEAADETDKSDRLNEERRKRKLEEGVTDSEEGEAPETESDSNRKSKEEECDAAGPMIQTQMMITKNRLRQRVTRNTALLDSVVVPHKTSRQK